MSAVFAAWAGLEPSGLRPVLQRSLGESGAAGVVMVRRLDIHRKDSAARYREKRLELVDARFDQLPRSPMQLAPPS